MDLVPKMDFLDVFYAHICYLTYSIPPHIRHGHHRTVLRISRFRVPWPAASAGEPRRGRSLFNLPAHVPMGCFARAAFQSNFKPHQGTVSAGCASPRRSHSLACWRSSWLRSWYLTAFSRNLSALIHHNDGPDHVHLIRNTVVGLSSRAGEYVAESIPLAHCRSRSGRYRW